MTNFLYINGNPHKGNTWNLSKLTQKFIMDLCPNAEFEEIHLSQLNLPFCTGCSLCFRKGHELCPHSDKYLA